MLTKDRLQFFTGLLRDVPMEDVIGLFANASERHLKYGQEYIGLNEFTKKLAYIQKGIIRAYAIKSNGDEATLLLRWDDQFIGSHDSILLNKPSKFRYMALEETTILEIDYSNVENIMAENPKFEPLRNFVLMNMLSSSLTMLEDFVLLNPEERYLKLIAEKANIVNRVADKHIASMLGITPVSLSRIRKRIATGK
ncbi:MAG: Crp/Fnr family transcriptional regulator [Flavobacterium sp.]|nr:MAG: Crp/Fnr family transcriptional regulator [Flavobacterium sp.]